MMKVNYRIVEEITPENTWETVGVIVHWASDPPHMQLRGLIAHTVSRPIWRAIGERVEQQQLTLENYHLALGEYKKYYRLLPEIHQLEAPTAAEIRRQLREQYVFKYDIPATQAVPA
jgi:hypothetical protein